MSESCKDCLYFHKEGGESICRRNPQYIFKNNDDWCGEFKPKNPLAPKETIKEHGNRSGSTKKRAR